MVKVTVSILVLLAAQHLYAAPLQIPSLNGPLTLDGTVDEDIWKQAAILPSDATNYGDAFPQGGELRALIRGRYLCLAAKLPETARIVARSTGEDPDFWPEDLIIWTVRFRAFDTYLKVSVNPLGAYRVDMRGLQKRLSEPLLVAAAVVNGSWGVELAIPINDLSMIGFLSAERVRVARPNAPELRWRWPDGGPGLPFRLEVSQSPAGQLYVVKSALATSPSSEKLPSASSSDLAAQLKTIPTRVWDDTARKAVGTDRMWENNLTARVNEAAITEKRAWQTVHSLADWQTFRQIRIDALKGSFGALPERSQLRMAVTRKLDYGEGFVLEDLIYESRPGLVVTANLYLPSQVSGRIPSIIVVHSHHAPKVQTELQDLGMTLARAGTAVLIMDQLGAGERIQSQPWPRESYFSRYAMGEQLYLAGESLMKWMYWDLERAVDLLLDQPYIDPKRIVMLGAVAGGGDPAAVTAALDERIAAVIPFNFGEAGPEEHFLRSERPYDSESADPGWGEWESTRCLRLSIARQFFPWFICASVAPRRFVYSFELGWPDGADNEPIWKRYKKVFELNGWPGNLQQFDGFGPFPGPGEVTDVGAQHLEKLYPILKRWLDIPTPVTFYHDSRPDADLMCLTPAVATERRPKTVSEIALPLAEGRLERARVTRSSLNTYARLQNLRISLKQKLGDIEPPFLIPRHTVWSRQLPGILVEAIALESASRISVPVFLITPKTSSKERLPVVIAFAQGGKQAFLSKRSDAIASLLQKHIAICLADVRGTGETMPFGTDSVASLAATELMLGETALGQRLKDARTVLHYLKSRNDINADHIVLWGDSFVDGNSRPGLLDQSIGQEPGPQPVLQSDPLGSLLALLTALYEDQVQAVATRGGLVSFLSVLEDRFAYVPQDVIVPGILEVGDISDVVAALAPRSTLLMNLVDGRNRRLTDAEAYEQYWPGNAQDRSRNAGVALRQVVNPNEIADWLAEQALGRNGSDHKP